MNLKFYTSMKSVISLFMVLSNAVLGESTDLVQVNDKNLNEFIKSALEGFRKVLAEGDEKLKIDSHDPHLIEDNLLWYYDDNIGLTRIFSSSQGVSFLYGLSSYAVEDVSASMRDLDVVIKLKFNRLQAVGKYKFGGHLFGGVVPLFGEGAFGAQTSRVDAILRVNMSLIDGRVGVDTTSVEINLDHFSVKAENLMKVPTIYSNALLNDILRRLYNEHKRALDYKVNEIFGEWTRYAVEGIKLQALMEFLEYLSKKLSSQ